MQILVSKIMRLDSNINSNHQINIFLTSSKYSNKYKIFKYHWIGKFSNNIDLKELVRKKHHVYYFHHSTYWVTVPRSSMLLFKPLLLLEKDLIYLETYFLVWRCPGSESKCQNNTAEIFLQRVENLNVEKMQAL